MTSDEFMRVVGAIRARASKYRVLQDDIVALAKSSPYAGHQAAVALQQANVLGACADALKDMAEELIASAEKSDEFDILNGSPLLADLIHSMSELPPYVKLVLQAEPESERVNSAPAVWIGFYLEPPAKGWDLARWDTAPAGAPDTCVHHPSDVHADKVSSAVGSVDDHAAARLAVNMVHEAIRTLRFPPRDEDT